MTSPVPLEELIARQLSDVEAEYAPRELYVEGERTLLAHGARVSIVGSRKVSHEGIQRTQRLARILSERNVIVVSGLARGVDTHAHQTAIARGGRTVAVLGTGLDLFYPPENATTSASHREGAPARFAVPSRHATAAGKLPSAQPRDGTPE